MSLMEKIHEIRTNRKLSKENKQWLEQKLREEDAEREHQRYLTRTRQKCINFQMSSTGVQSIDEQIQPLSVYKELPELVLKQDSQKQKPFTPVPSQLKIKLVDIIPNCSNCEHPAEFEIPTIHQYWCFVCSTCKPMLQLPRLSESIGFTLKARTDIMPGIEVSDIEEVIMGRVNRIIGCPTCGYQNKIKTEIKGGIQCQKCQQRLIVKDILDYVN